MSAARRWLVVGLSTLLLASVPALVRLLPATDSTISAADLLTQVQGSTSTPYTGYAESVGGLAIPVTGEFTGLSDLLGDRTAMRVWWRSPTSWRVDTVSAAGESDLYLDGTSTYTWDYERARVTVVPEGAIRLPRSADLLPTELGQRLLSEASPQEVTRLPAKSVAGRSALGLRLTPADARSTIDRVEVWVDPGTGLPLEVALYAAGATRPAVSTSFLDFSSDAPEASVTQFSLPQGVRVDASSPGSDLEEFASRYTDVTAPATLAGLPRRDTTEGLGHIGTYGRGTTVLIAVRLSGRITGPLRDQLGVVPGAVVDDNGVALTFGPVSLLIAPRGQQRGSWVVAGTVDVATLTQAAAELAAVTP